MATRWAAVTSFYRYQADANQVPVAQRLSRLSASHRRSGYTPALGHTHRSAHRESVVRIRKPNGAPMPLLTPAQVCAILDDCARWDVARRCWVGSIRDRLIFATLAETGLRLGECLSLPTATGTPGGDRRPLWRWCRAASIPTGCAPRVDATGGCM